MSIAASAAATPLLSRQGSLRRQRRWFLTFCLAPSLSVLMVVTLLPMAYLLLTSFTPLNLTNPASEWNFQHPLVNYALLPGDVRFLNSLWVQAKLSFWTVFLQLLIGLSFALLLNLKSGLVQAARTVFLIPMVLPPIVVAIIWKVLYTPDISPVHWLLRALGWDIPALITNPEWALTAIIIADTWEWFPLTMLMVLAALQTVPEELIELGAGRRRRRLADDIACAAALHPRHADGGWAVPSDRQHKGVPADLSVDGRRSRLGDGGHQLLRLPAGVQFLLSRFLFGDHRGVGRCHPRAQLVRGAADRMGRSRMSAKRTNRLIIQALVIGLAALVLAPFLWLVRMSFETNAQIFAFPPRLWFTPTIGNYLALWQTEFRHSFLNSTVVSLASTLASMVVGVPAAYALSRMRRHSDMLSLWIIASRLAPPTAFAIPYFLVYRELDLIDTRLGLVIIYLTFNISLVIWLMRSFFENTPRAFEEAAWIDGAGFWQGLIRIVLPTAAPGLAATAILCFVFSWNDFFFALILTRSDAMTAPVAVVNFMNYEGWEWGRIAAGGTMVMLPVLVFSLVVRRFLISGLTAGAIKG